MVKKSTKGKKRVKKAPKKCGCTKTSQKIVNVKLAKAKLMKAKKDIEAKKMKELLRVKTKAKKEIAKLKKKYVLAEKKAKEHIHKDPEKAIKIAAAVGAAIGFSIRHSLRKKKKK